MFLTILLLIVSLAMILLGANWLIDGGSGVAKRFGLSEIVIGLTIVAFGTSAPEFVISALSSVKGNAEIAIGNVVGSNIVNVLFIIGITAMIRPIKVEHNTLNNEIPLVIVASLSLLACGNSVFLDKTPNMVSRVEGIMMLLFFAIFVRYTFTQAKAELPAEIPEAKEKPLCDMPLGKALFLIAIGLVGLIWGGDIFVNSASKLASALGVSDAIIGLTIVAIGTSLPELAASVVAAVKGLPSLAVGNIVGSCIFNIFFVLGVSAVIRPLPFGDIGNLDLLTMTGAAILFWLFGWLIGKRTITRPEGLVMALLYCAYSALLIAKA